MLEESTGNFSATRNIYDWYQTATHVILNVMIKNLKESDVKVKLIDETLDVSCNLADGSEFKLHFNLFKSIYVSESSWTVSPSKLEIKLKKTDRKRWQSLEVLPDKSGKRPISFIGFVQQNATKKLNTTIGRVNSGLDEKPKYDWHQTTTHVTITIHIRNLNAEDVRVEFSENLLNWCCKLPDGTDYEVKVCLFKPINVEQSSWQLSISKLEITLRKRDNGRWSNLEAMSQMIKSTSSPPGNKYTTTIISEASPEPSCSSVDNETDVMNNNSVNDVIINEVNDVSVINCSENSDLDNHEKSYNVNYTLVTIEQPNNESENEVHEEEEEEDDNKEDKNLDNLEKIVTEFKEKEKQLEEAEKTSDSDGHVTELIREIYEKGGEEVRRAMNKRFNESGTNAVLSFETIKSDIDVKPIDINTEVVCELTQTFDATN